MKHATRNPLLQTPAIKPAGSMLLQEIGKLSATTTSLRPLTWAQLEAVACSETGSCSDNRHPIAAMVSRLRGLELRGLVELERVPHESRSSAMDRDRSTLRLTAAGLRALEPHPAAHRPGPRVAAPTWRGDCMQANCTDAVGRMAPVLRPGAMDFRACPSRGF